MLMISMRNLITSQRTFSLFSIQTFHYVPFCLFFLQLWFLTSYRIYTLHISSPKRLNFVTPQNIYISLNLLKFLHNPYSIQCYFVRFLTHSLHFSDVPYTFISELFSFFTFLRPQNFLTSVYLKIVNALFKPFTPQRSSQLILLTT